MSSVFKTILFIATCIILPGCSDEEPSQTHIHPPSVQNPGGFPHNQVPQFIVLGSDDNTNVEAMYWLLDYLESKIHRDGSRLRMSFYSNSRSHVNWHHAPDLVQAHKRAMKLGHELGNHTSNHARLVSGLPGHNQVRVGTDSIYRIINELNEDLIELVGVAPQQIVGFRTPYLAWSDSVFTAARMANMLYDCSINESTGGPGNYIWPYTMEEGAPQSQYSWWVETHHTPVGSHPGLWQLPCYMFRGPASLTAHMDSLADFAHDNLITGLDYNLWAAPPAGWLLDRKQSLETLKNTLNLKWNGNRTPMTIGIHSQYYADDFHNSGFARIRDAHDRRAVLEAFIDYALTLENVWFVSAVQVISYMKDPVSVDCFHPDEYFFP